MTLTPDQIRALNELPKYVPALALDRTKTPLDLGDEIISMSAAAKYGPTGIAAEVFVDAALGDDVTGDGEGWATAYASIERALADVDDTGIPFERFVTIRCKGAFGSVRPVVMRKRVVGAIDSGTFTALGGLVIRGEPDTLDVALALSSAGAGPDDATANLDLGVSPGAIVAGKTFVVQELLGREIWYPAINIVGSVVTVVGASYFFTPGETLRVVDVGGTDGATLQDPEFHLQGLVQVAGFHLVAGVTTAAFIGETPWFAQGTNGPLVSGLAVDTAPYTTVFNRLTASGLHFIGAVPVDVSGSFLDDASCTGATTFASDESSAVQFFRHTGAVGTKFTITGGHTSLFGVQVLSGAGSGFRVVNRGVLEALYDVLVAGATLTHVADVTEGGTFAFRGGSALQGSTAGFGVTLREGALAVGLEAAVAAGTGFTSTPGGSDVTLGAGGQVTFASLPATNAAELVRAS
jgi:hypothetical protein